MRQIKSTLIKNGLKFKALFNELASQESSYPRISFSNFVNFCKHSGILDNTGSSTQTRSFYNSKNSSKTGGFRKSNKDKMKSKNLDVPTNKPILTMLDIATEFAQTTLEPAQIITKEQAPSSLRMIMDRQNWAAEK